MAGDLQSYAILFSIFLISALLLRTIFSNTKPTKHLPPSPTAIPIIGHLHLLAPLPHQAFHNLSTRYGPLIHLRLGSIPAFVASNPDTAKEILKTQETNFASRPVSSAVRHLTYGSADFSFAPYGPYWRFMKKLCLSELLGGRTLDHMRPVRQEEITAIPEAGAVEIPEERSGGRGEGADNDGEQHDIEDGNEPDMLGRREGGGGGAEAGA